MDSGSSSAFSTGKNYDFHVPHGKSISPSFGIYCSLFVASQTPVHDACYRTAGDQTRKIIYTGRWIVQASASRLRWPISFHSYAIKIITAVGHWARLRQHGA